MPAELQSVLDAALQLPDADREALAERLWESLDGEEPDEAEFAAEWDEEIRQRIEDMRSGKETPVPWEEVRRLLSEDLNGPAG